MDKDRLPTYGGQAVIEGVMMRGRDAMAIAMRSPDRSIVIHRESLSGIYKSKVTRIPFLRGIVMLWDALGLGMRALTISANTQTEEDDRIEGPQLVVTLILSLSFAIGLFFLLPAGLGYLTDSLFPPSGSSISAWTGNLVEGIARLVILIAYIWFIGRIPDIRRVFAYHGAEHKTINAFEAGAQLTPESVKRFSLEHPRCGTAFLLTLIVLSIIVFTLAGPLPLGLRLLSRILMIPVLAGIAYEYIRWTAKNLNSPFVKMLIRPNLALQRLTTREPDPEMLEVSIAAFTAMRSGEKDLAL
jgi:uncharacterized protein YqhQ